MTEEEAIELSNTATVKYSLSEEQRRYAYRIAASLEAGSVIVELGVAHGPTSIVLAYVAKHFGLEYHGVDVFVLENTAEQWRGMMMRLGLPHTLHYGYTNEVPWSKPIDLLLIDASHTDPFVDQDCVRWLPFVKPGKIAMFHDVDGAPEPLSGHWPVRRAVNRYTDEWHTMYYIDGLLIKRKPPDPMPIYDVHLSIDPPVEGQPFVINGDGEWNISPLGRMVNRPQREGQLMVCRGTDGSYPYWLWREQSTWKMTQIREVEKMMIYRGEL